MTRAQNTMSVAESVLRRNAVKFDSNLRYNDQDAWPFWYPFIPSPYQDTDKENGGLGLIGFLIEPGAVRDIPVLFERDAAYRHINTKFTVNQCSIKANLAGTITVVAGTKAVIGVATDFVNELTVGQRFAYLDSNGLFRCNIISSITDALNLTLADAPVFGGAGVNYGLAKWVWVTNTPIAAPAPQIPITFEYTYTPITRFVEVALNIPSLKNINFYGDNLYESNGGLVERRVPITNLQGVNDGNPMVRTPDALVPAEGTVLFTVANNHTQPVFVNGTVFGYKLALQTDSGV